MALMITENDVMDTESEQTFDPNVFDGIITLITDKVDDDRVSQKLDQSTARAIVTAFAEAARFVKTYDSLFYSGDLSIAISMLIFCLLMAGTFYWACNYPDNRRDKTLEFVAFLKHDGVGEAGGGGGAGDDGGAGGENSKKDQVALNMEGSSFQNQQSPMSASGSKAIPHSGTPNSSIGVSSDRASLSGSNSARMRRTSLTQNPNLAGSSRPQSSLATETHSLNTATNAEAKLDKKADKEKKN